MGEEDETFMREDKSQERKYRKDEFQVYDETVNEGSLVKINYEQL